MINNVYSVNDNNSVNVYGAVIVTTVIAKVRADFSTAN